MMKLTALKIRDRLDQPATALFSDQKWVMNMEHGIVTIQHVETKEEFCIPMSNVIWFKRASTDGKPTRGA